MYYKKKIEYCRRYTIYWQYCIYILSGHVTQQILYYTIYITSDKTIIFYIYIILYNIISLAIFFCYRSHVYFVYIELSYLISDIYYIYTTYKDNRVYWGLTIYKFSCLLLFHIYPRMHVFINKDVTQMLNIVLYL